MPPKVTPKAIERIYRRERERTLTVLLRITCDLDLAEDALHESFEAALDIWPKRGFPRNPSGWISKVAHNYLRRAPRDATAHRLQVHEEGGKQGRREKD